MQLQTKKLDEINVDSLAQLVYESRQNSPLQSEDRTLERIKNWFERMIEEDSGTLLLIIALNQETNEILGMLTIGLDWGEIGLIQPWQPIIHPNVDQDVVATALIDHSKKLVETHSKSKIEIWMELQNEEVKRIEPTYSDWYQKCGFILSSQEYFMDTKKSNLKELRYSIPNNIEVIPMSTISNDEIKDTLFKTFRNSSDEWAQTQTDSQLRGAAESWLKRDETFDGKASIVLKNGSKIIGYNVVRVEPSHIELGPIGVLPSYRGKGLGRALVLESIQKLSGDEQTIGLTVSTKNSVAQRLYSSLGFEKRYKILIYSWFPK